jgi:hypothetical protein
MRPLPLPLALLALLAGCADSANARGDSAGTTGSAHPVLNAPVNASVAGSADSATIATPRGPTFVRGDSVPGARAVFAQPLHWTAADIVARLHDAGLAPVANGSVDQSILGVPGLRLLVANGAAEVDGFIFADADAVGLATRAVNLGRLAAGTRTASLLTDNNMAALVITADDAVRGRIAFALDASRTTGR